MLCIQRQGELLLAFPGKPAGENMNPSHLLQCFIVLAHLCRRESQSRTDLLALVDHRSRFIGHLACGDPLRLRVHQVKRDCPHYKAYFGGGENPCEGVQEATELQTRLEQLVRWYVPSSSGVNWRG
jgi:hypothetical protein